MQFFRPFLLVVGFCVSCSPSHALEIDDGDPTDLGCVIPFERNCDFNPLTDECADVCADFGDHCGRWAAYHDDWYMWARYLQPGETWDTYDGFRFRYNSRESTFGSSKSVGANSFQMLQWILNKE